jgi:Ca2+-binding RTX toxin-like protein
MRQLTAALAALGVLLLGAAGASGNGTPKCFGEPATIVGSGVIDGTEGADVILGSNGDDTIFALGGDDLVWGSAASIASAADSVTTVWTAGTAATSSRETSTPLFPRGRISPAGTT